MEVRFRSQTDELSAIYKFHEVGQGCLRRLLPPSFRLQTEAAAQRRWFFLHDHLDVAQHDIKSEVAAEGHQTSKIRHFRDLGLEL